MHNGAHYPYRFAYNVLNSLSNMGGSPSKGSSRSGGPRSGAEPSSASSSAPNNNKGDAPPTYPKPEPRSISQDSKITPAHDSKSESKPAAGSKSNADDTKGTAKNTKACQIN